MSDKIKIDYAHDCANDPRNCHWHEKIQELRTEMVSGDKYAKEQYKAYDEEIARLKAETEWIRNHYEKDYNAMRNVANAWKAKVETLAGALKKIIEKGIAADPLPELISVEIAKAALAEYEQGGK